VLYSGKDIRTSAGLEYFYNESSWAWRFLARRAYGAWDGIKEGEEELE
jgi:hypothetical protein